MQISIYVIGDSEVGKTTYIRRLATGEFRDKYEKTDKIGLCRIKKYTNCGQVDITLYDVPPCDVDKPIYKTASGILLMHSPGEITSKYVDIIRKWNKKVPIVHCCTKVDIRQPTDVDVESIRLSSKANYNFELPLLSILRTVAQTNAIKFIAEPEEKVDNIKLDMMDVWLRNVKDRDIESSRHLYEYCYEHSPKEVVDVLVYLTRYLDDSEDNENLEIIRYAKNNALDVRETIKEFYRTKSLEEVSYLLSHLVDMMK